MTPTALRTALLRWYEQNGRDLPWRIRGGRQHPYKVWLSEIMLQQTVAAAVKPYFAKFLERWPSVEALAAAPREDVLSAWAGLGYYARARNLHAGAQALAAHGFPQDEAGWRAIPGVGAYTAAAVASIALDQPANVVDGNVERVMSRLFAVETPLPDAKPELRDLAAQFVSKKQPGDWAQALMDLGATICTPKSPKCGDCPIRLGCKAYETGAPETYPRKRAKAAKPRRHGVAFWLERDGAVLLTRRPDKGLLGGMMALPSTPWRDDPWADDALEHAPAKADWENVGAVEHVFTHFALTLEVWRGAAGPPASPPASRSRRNRRSTSAHDDAGEDADGPHHWRAANGLDSAGLPTVFRKAADRARGSD